MKSGLKLAASILICEATGVLSSLVSLTSFQVIFANLKKPSFAPPAWVFGPTWTILYLLMGISLYLIWKNYKKSQKARNALMVFGVQLFLNFAWSPVFFGYGNIFLALVIIILLLYYIIATISAFYKINKAAAYLLIPYFFWVSFATILNFAIWQLNG